MRKLGEIILKYWYLFILFVLMATVFCGLNFKNLKFDTSVDTWFSKSDQTLKEYNEFQDLFNTSETIFISYSVNDPFSVKELEYLQYLTEEIENMPKVTSVTNIINVNDIAGTFDGIEIKPLIDDFSLSTKKIKAIIDRVNINPFMKNTLISKDQKVLGILIKLEKIFHEESTNERLLPVLRKFLSTEEKRTKHIFHIGGVVVTNTTMNEIMAKDIAVFFPISLLITAFVLFLLFKNFNNVIFPIFVVLIVLVWTLGLKGFLNSPISIVSITLFVLVTVIGIADSVHLISQFRLEMFKVNNKKTAILNTYEKAGFPCLLTSVTTAVGFGSLSVSKVYGIQQLGIFAAFGIMAAFVISIILVPLSLLIMRYKPSKANNDSVQKIMQSVLALIGKINIKKGKTALTICLVFFLLMLFGIPLIQVEGTMLASFKKNSQIYLDTKFIDENLTGTSTWEVMIYGNEDDIKNPIVLETIDQMTEELKQFPKVAVCYSVVDFVKLIRRALHEDNPEYYSIPETREEIAQSLLLYEIGGGEEIFEYVSEDFRIARLSIRTQQMKQNERKELINFIKSYSNDNFSKYKIITTGLEQIGYIVTQNIVKTQIESLAIAFIIILIMMIFLFGLKGGLISIIPNIFPVAIIFGIMGYFNFRLNIATAMIASIAIGIVVDDTIHYFSHYRAAIKQTGDPVKAMQISLAEVGKALCFTSIILAMGFMIFLFSDIKILVYFGILSSITIIVALSGDLFIGPILLSKIRIFKKKYH